MAKQYAVLHTEKGKASGGGIGNHIDRKFGMEHTYPHADPKRLHLNIDFTEENFKYKTLPEAISIRIQEGYTAEKKIRNDAVKYLSTVLTGTHEQMKEIAADHNSFEKWIQANYSFACNEFGKENIVRFVVHLDEKTPHLHCVHVPLTADGRLSAKEIMGDAKKLKLRQDKYALAMKPFGLQRGEVRQGVHHETAQDYYRRINITEDFIENLDVEGLFGVKTNETLKKTKEALKIALMDIERLKTDIQRTETSLKNVKENSQSRIQHQMEKIKVSEGKLQEALDFTKQVLEDPEFYKMIIELKNHKKEQKNVQKKPGKNRGQKM
jgi:hypothetical protein